MGLKSHLAVAILLALFLASLRTGLSLSSPAIAPRDRASPDVRSAGGVPLLAHMPDGCIENRILAPASPPVAGPDVKELQEYLLGLGLYSGAVDGIYGDATRDAVRALQERLDVPATGVYDPATWIELEGGAPVGQQAVPPPPGKVLIKIDVNESRLTVYSDGAVHKNYTVAIGKYETPSPLGEFKVLWKETAPGGAFGSRWMGLNVPWGTYGIHGTNRPWTVGYAASHGCFRMFNHDVEEIFPWIEVGTPVIIEGDLDYSACPEVLRRGFGNQDVVMLQVRLRDRGFYTDSADGDFGPLTETAVKDMQIHYGLEPTGVTSADLMNLLGF